MKRRTGEPGHDKKEARLDLRWGGSRGMKGFDLRANFQIFLLITVPIHGDSLFNSAHDVNKATREQEALMQTS